MEGKTGEAETRSEGENKWKKDKQMQKTERKHERQKKRGMGGRESKDRKTVQRSRDSREDESPRWPPEKEACFCLSHANPELLTKCLPALSLLI